MGRKLNPNQTLKQLEEKLGFTLGLKHEDTNRKVRNDKKIKTFQKEQAKKK